jgi:hypothetical protein
MRILDSRLFLRHEMDRAFYAVGRLLLFFRLFFKSREKGATRSIQSHTGRAPVSRDRRSFDVVTAGKDRFSLGIKERLNHPGNLKIAYQALAALRGVSEDELRRQIERISFASSVR